MNRGFRQVAIEALGSEWRGVKMINAIRWFSATLVLMLVLLWQPAGSQAKPPDMAAEPHYHLLLENTDVRVFALTIRPHEQTFVRHERNFLTIALQDGEIAMWRQGESPVQHFRSALGEVRFLTGDTARGMRNDSSSEYRNITVEFKDPRVTNYGYRPDTGKWDYSLTVLDFPVDPHGQFVNSLDLEAAVVDDVQLLSRNTLPPSNASMRELLIAVTAVDLDYAGNGSIHLAPGEVRWLDALGPKLTNAGSAPARFVLVKLR